MEAYFKKIEGKSIRENRTAMDARGLDDRNVGQSPEHHDTERFVNYCSFLAWGPACNAYRTFKLK